MPETSSEPSYRDRVVASMLWSAWADAVGFISELTDEAGLKRRTAGRPLNTSMDWKRRVGGQYGVQASMPAGTYSDDTQLRLAVARAISQHGFDVEAFARIELPVWPAYALGGGRASRAAAAGMAKANATWHTNFYSGWTKAGGNGAAMRIQPHVWVGGLDDTYIVPVLRDVVVTHGHPRAIVGAVLHAVSLAFCLRERHAPKVGDWASLINATHRALRFFSDDRDLAHIWVPAWEREEQRSFEGSWHDTVNEVVELLHDAERFVETVRHDPAVSSAAYLSMADEMGLTDKRTLGSGTASVVAALALSAAYPTDPSTATLLAANAVGTDTDTIATIAAAMIAAAAPAPLPGPVQDEDYLRDEATRLALIAAHRPASAFPYPDTLKWRPPQSQLDAVGTGDGGLALAGLGWLEPFGEPLTSRDWAWSWMRSSIGVTVLVKHRLDPKPLPAGNWPSERTMDDAPSPSEPRALHPTLFDEHEDARGAVPQESRPAGTQRATPSVASIDDAFERMDLNAFDDASIVNALREVARRGTRDQFAVLVGQLWTILRRE